MMSAPERRFSPEDIERNMRAALGLLNIRKQEASKLNREVSNARVSFHMALFMAAPNKRVNKALN